MSVAWTKEQQKVIELRERNILVSAAAGSGKTAVLVERIITMLTDEQHPLDVDRLLIVTFTEAAAAEMKERIRNAIEKKLIECPDNEHLKQQATLIHGAQITTIHSFCLSVIRDHFHAIQIDPGFRIGEEGELKLLKHDVLGQVLEACYEEGTEDFLDFTDAYAPGRDDKRLEDLILKLYEYSRSYPDQDAWLWGCAEAYAANTEEELEAGSYMGLIKKQIETYLSDAVQLLTQGCALCSEPDGPAVYEEALQADMQLLEGLLKADSYRSYYEVFKDISFVRLKSNRDKTVSEEKSALVKAIREEVKLVIKEIAAQYFFQSPEGMLEDMQLCSGAMQELTGLVLRFACAYEEKKRSQNMIDFGDMEQYALRILTEKQEGMFVPSMTALEYQKQFQEIMIDEYQDSNFIQETILTSVSTVSLGKYNIFMVGDVKQSIYRFRLSRPELFMEKFHAYDLEKGNCQRVDLHKNFRSRPQVLLSVNFLFRQIMTEGLGGIVYDADAALNVGAAFLDGEEAGQYDSEVILLEAEGVAMSERELEARSIALRIRRLLKHQLVQDKKTGELRRTKCSDIVILTRSVKGFTDVYAEILNREGIPTYAGTKEGYFKTQEIGTLLDYLRILNNQKQDIPLASVLTSGICRLTDRELSMIKSECREEPFCQAVCCYAAAGADEELRQKIREFLEQLEAMRKRVPYTPMHELLWSILEETGYGDYVAALPGGAQRQANVEMLVEKARIFEATSYKGLFHFIRYMEQLRKYDVDYGEASLEDEQSDTVRIMTIHKSKGLEFPIVIVAGMGKQFNMQDARSSVVLHARLGVGLNAVDLTRRTKSPTLLKKVIQKEEALDSLGEELRVLYVALTRAKEKLIIIGTVKGIEKKLESCQVVAGRKEQELSYSMLSKAITFWDFLLPALVRKPEDIPLIVYRITAEELEMEAVVETVSAYVTRAELEQPDMECIYDERLLQNMEEQFTYEYPYKHVKEQKIKFTVSELKKRNYIEEEAGELLYEEELIPLIPNFLQEKEELSGASRGTAYHRLLELLDFAKDYNAQSLADEINELRIKGKLTADMAACILTEDIIFFLESSLVRRMRAAAQASQMWKEQPFVLGMDAREMYPQEEAGELVLVQGIIDVYFEEEELVVVDYKTDRVRNEEELSEKYQAQLGYYAKALEQLTGKKVKEKIIYSFQLKEEIQV